jgi:CheY-like chemotaxis protein/REP element-mobilizing transposase RayT
MALQVLVINHWLTFTVSLKQALERTRSFNVHPFTTADAALDYLREHPQDVALVDFTLPGLVGEDIVRQLRAIQPTLAIIASPAQPDSVARELRLQNTLDTPFSARDVIPLLNQAAEATRSGVPEPPPPAAPPPAPPKMRTGMLSKLDDGQPAVTRSLEPPAKPPPDTETYEDAPRNPMGTRILSDDSNPAGTRILSDENPPMGTRILNDASNPMGTRILNDDNNPMGTRILNDDDSFEPTPPSFSSLDSVLADMAQSDLFDIPVEEGDTPPVSGTPPSETPPDWFPTIAPMTDETPNVQRPKSNIQPPPRKSDPFSDLVNSMRNEEPRKPLHERTQPFVEFILPGMGEPDKEGETFQRLADEEPPMPTFEESGTVGDLMTGVDDSSFRNVLSILRGDEPPVESASQPTMTDEEMKEAFLDFYGETAPAEVRPIQPPPAQPERDTFDFDDSPTMTDDDREEKERTPAQMILETALDETTPPEQFSLDALIANIERQLPEYKPHVQPLPSWIQETERYIREPDFLPEELPSGASSLEFSSEFADETTRPSARQRMDTEPDQFDTESIEVVSGRTQPANMPEWDVTEPETHAEPIFGDAENVDLDDFLADAFEPTVYEPEDVEIIASDSESFEPSWDEMLVERTLNTDEVPLIDEEWPDSEVYVAPRVEPQEELFAEPVIDQVESYDLVPDDIDTPIIGASPVEDPRVVQLALSLTQASLESTAEATLLTRDGIIVAYAGQLMQEEVEELRDAIADDWDAGPDQARVRFITLPGSAKDYMLYSRRTDDDLTLSMIFVGTTPLRDIRRQGKRLAEALQSVPETQTEQPPPRMAVVEEVEMDEASASVPIRTLAPTPAPTPPRPAEVGPLVGYACLWIIRDPNSRLNEETAQAIMSGLHMQLQEQAWQIQTIEAQDEYVYLLVDIPGETPPPEIIRDLKRRSAEIAHAQDPAVDQSNLWADSYLMITPGRALDMDEIQQFISFERMM